ncbi:hypothetical protein BGZ98_007628 [Dissophora globulifera]|nr:hypothetical protein BGZ98_007628 [Dissophora globulifera]
MSNQLLYYTAAFGIFLVALLFCFAYDINNGYIYYPLALFLGFKASAKFINYLSPTAFDPPPPPEPKTRQEKKKAAKDAEAQAKRNEMLLRREADAARKAAEAREFD